MFGPMKEALRGRRFSILKNHFRGANVVKDATKILFF
jgi:hypothetical protein